MYARPGWEDQGALCCPVFPSSMPVHENQESHNQHQVVQEWSPCLSPLTNPLGEARALGSERSKLLLLPHSPVWPLFCTQDSCSLSPPKLSLNIIDLNSSWAPADVVLSVPLQYSFSAAGRELGVFANSHPAALLTIASWCPPSQLLKTQPANSPARPLNYPWSCLFPYEFQKTPGWVCQCREYCATTLCCRQEKPIVPHSEQDSQLQEGIKGPWLVRQAPHLLSRSSTACPAFNMEVSTPRSSRGC